MFAPFLIKNSTIFFWLCWIAKWIGVNPIHVFSSIKAPWWINNSAMSMRPRDATWWSVFFRCLLRSSPVSISFSILVLFSTKKIQFGTTEYENDEAIFSYLLYFHCNPRFPYSFQVILFLLPSLEWNSLFLDKNSQRTRTFCCVLMNMRSYHKVFLICKAKLHASADKVPDQQARHSAVSYPSKSADCLIMRPGPKGHGTSRYAN